MHVIRRHKNLLHFSREYNCGNQEFECKGEDRPRGQRSPFRNQGVAD